MLWSHSQRIRNDSVRKYSTTDAVLRQFDALGLTTLKGNRVPKQTILGGVS